MRDTSRKRYSAEYKTAIVLEALKRSTNVAALLRREAIAEGTFYEWRDRFISAGKKALHPAKPKHTLNKDGRMLVDASELQSSENRSAALKHYARLLAPIIGKQLRISDKLKREIISLVEASDLTKKETLYTLGVPRTSYYRWLKFQTETGDVTPPTSPNRKVKIAEREDIKKAVFEVLHAPPIDFGFNRSTWKFEELQEAVQSKGVIVGRHAVRKIIRDAGYQWRKAREVLTSKDPDYRYKLDHIHEVLGALKRDEGFYSIDEFGPFAVKHRKGRKLVAPGEEHVVQQWQKSKGALIITAAIELQTNQVTHFYSKKKNTEEMIKLLDLLLTKYSYLSKIYLSWDAASWHVSKKLNEHIEVNNERGVTQVEVAPLPAGAQFLNVIEAVFSGMARTVLHNSNYKSVAAAKTAINRYFDERNQRFIRSPKRAGNKIWGPLRFGEEFNHKDAKYR